jgi:hypothetical protein
MPPTQATDVKTELPWVPLPAEAASLDKPSVRMKSSVLPRTTKNEGAILHSSAVLLIKAGAIDFFGTPAWIKQFDRLEG